MIKTIVLLFCVFNLFIYRTFLCSYLLRRSENVEFSSLIFLLFSLKVLWDGEWVDGTGRSTGEETEQVFSFLSRFCNTTKYQKPESKLTFLFNLKIIWIFMRCIEIQ